MRRFIRFLLLYLVIGLPLYSSTPLSLLKSVVYSLGYRAAQDMGHAVQAEDSEIVPELLQDDKLDATLQHMLTEKYPGLVFVKQQGGDLTAHRNIIYVGREWETALMAEEYKDDFMPLFEEVIRYYLQKNASGFYDKNLVGTIGSDVAIGIACWNQFPQLQNCFKGRLKIAGLTCVLGMAATRAIMLGHHAWYDFVSQKPETERP